MASAAQEPAAEPQPEPVRPIIVKKITVQAAGHHGGAWKVAYADFVTAMMAFFLMLWLLGATTEAQRRGLADHFAPTLIQYRDQSAGSNGLLKGDSITGADNYPNAAGQTGTQAITIPKDTVGGPREGAAMDRNAVTRAEAIRKNISEQLARSRRLARLARQVRVMTSPEGIRIDLVDDADFSMFALGTTMLLPEARELLGVIAATIADDPAAISVRGHTDALPWKPGVTSNNWSLSTGRAEATRQELMRAGITERRFNRIEGVADREPLIDDNPEDPRNRRMSILLMQ